MKKSNIFKILILTLIPVVFSVFTFMPVFADPPSAAECNNMPPIVQEANGCTNAGNAGDIGVVIQGILNGIISVSGIVAVIFIIIGGIQYMTSAGDASKVEKGKKTILYACIGLIICVLSFAIVNFVIINIINSGSTQPASSYTSQQDCQNAGHTWNTGNNTCE